jgi:hypothetical protein
LTLINALISAGEVGQSVAPSARTSAGTSKMTFRLIAVSPVDVAYFWVGVVPPVVEVVEPEPALPVVISVLNADRHEISTVPVYSKPA